MNQSRKYRLKSVVVDAVQWFKNGDHPEDESVMIQGKSGEEFLSEGRVVRYYRTPDLDGQVRCEKCGTIMHFHGWIDTEEKGYIICPGDWIIKNIKGGFYPRKPDMFKILYEEVTKNEE